MRPLIVFSESKAMQESFIHKFNFILWSQGKLCGSLHNVQKAFLSKPQNIPTMLGL